MIHLPIRGKALYLALTSSGIRIGEALRLTPEDLDMDQDPVKVSIRGEYTKTGNLRTKEELEEWLKVRDRYLEAAAGKSHKYRKSFEDPRVFPSDNNTAYAFWTNALNKAGFLKKDKGTNRHTVHPHVLRKFSRTKMATLIPVDVVEALMGHEGCLTEVYRRYSLEDLAKFYKQDEGLLLIFTEAGEVSRIKAEIDERNRHLQTLVNGLTAENLELRSRLSHVELGYTELKKTLEKMLS